MRILIADDHPLHRDAAATRVRRLYPEAVVEEVSSLDEIFSRAAYSDYDLFLVDYHMPGMSRDATAKLVEAFPHTPLAIISGTADHDAVRAAIASGAKGFVPKTATSDQFASAVRMLLAGGTSIPAEILRPGAAADACPVFPEIPWLAALSPRGLQVLKAVARGIPNKQIARELGLAEVTVKLHLRAVFRKTGTHTRAEAAVLATKAGIG